MAFPSQNNFLLVDNKSKLYCCNRYQKILGIKRSFGTKKRTLFHLPTKCSYGTKKDYENLLPISLIYLNLMLCFLFQADETDEVSEIMA